MAQEPLIPCLRRPALDALTDDNRIRLVFKPIEMSLGKIAVATDCLLRN
jgi:hypothetical protein